jgi:hypothetical protein
VRGSHPSPESSSPGPRVRPEPAIGRRFDADQVNATASPCVILLTPGA